MITVECTDNVLKGNVVAYDSTLNKWALATSTNSLLGVAIQDCFVDQDNTDRHIVAVKFQGNVQAIASRDITNQGGCLNVENGRVYIDTNDTYHCAMIMPNFLNSNARVAGDLVTITLR